MRFDREPWRKLYRAEPFEQRAWPLMARGLRDYLVRLPEDDGVLLRDPSENPVEDLMRALNSDVTEREHVRNACELLFEHRFLVVDDRGLRIRNFEDAQQARSPAAKRMAAKRAREKSDPSGGNNSGSGHSGPPNRSPQSPRNSDVTRAEQVTVEEKEKRGEEKRVRNARASTPKRDPMGYLAAANNPEVEWAFQQWRNAFGQQAAQLTAQRANALQARFEEAGDSWRDQVAKVLAAGKADPFIVDDCAGELLRLFDKRERFELYLRGGPKKRRSKTAVQPDVPGSPNYRPDRSKYEVTL